MNTLHTPKIFLAIQINGYHINKKPRILRKTVLGELNTWLYNSILTKTGVDLVLGLSIGMKIYDVLLIHSTLCLNLTAMELHLHQLCRTIQLITPCQESRY